MPRTLLVVFFFFFFTLFNKGFLCQLVCFGDWALMVNKAKSQKVHLTVLGKIAGTPP